MQKGQKFEKFDASVKKVIKFDFFSLKNFQIQTALKIHEIFMFHKFYSKIFHSSNKSKFTNFIDRSIEKNLIPPN